MARFRSYHELMHGWHGGPVYRVVLLVVSETVLDDGTIAQEVEQWADDDGDAHPFECWFDDMDEARAYAQGFCVELAQYVSDHGSGPESDGVACGVIMLADGPGSSLTEIVTLREWQPYGIDTVDWDEDGNATYHSTDPDVDAEMQAWADEPPITA